MSSTQRSESMHSFFDGYVHSRTNLSEFVDQYELAVRKKIEKEMQEDFTSANTKIPCVTRWGFEHQLCKAYSNLMFKRVQKELTNIMYCDVGQVKECGSQRVFKVVEVVCGAGKRAKRVSYEVTFTAENADVKCNCQDFEFRGILCCHALKVLTANDVLNIPDRYILRRWRKDVCRRHSKIRLGSLNPSVENTRLKELEKVFYSSSDYAVVDVSKYEFLMKGLKEQFVQLQKWAHEPIEKNDGKHEEAKIGHTVKYKDPAIVKRRGRPRSKRILASIEQAAGLKPVKRRQVKAENNEVGKQVLPSATQVPRQAHEGRLSQARSSACACAVGCDTYHFQIWQQQRAALSASSSSINYLPGVHYQRHGNWGNVTEVNGNMGADAMHSYAMGVGFQF